MYHLSTHAFFFIVVPRPPASGTSPAASAATALRAAPNLPTNIAPYQDCLTQLSGKSPMGLRIPPLRIKIMLESKPLKSTMLVGGLGVLPTKIL